MLSEFYYSVSETDLRLFKIEASVFYQFPRTGFCGGQYSGRAERRTILPRLHWLVCGDDYEGGGVNGNQDRVGDGCKWGWKGTMKRVRAGCGRGRRRGHGTGGTMGCRS